MDFGETNRTRPGLTPEGTLRAWLVLARASNLPTVWSNCIAGSWLGGWNSGATILLLCLAASLLYTGGMFLNDVCDVAFDREYKPERPIVAGGIARRAAGVAAIVFLSGGVLLTATINSRAALFAAILALTIVAYDLAHKRISWAPLLMAACRFLLYLMAAAAGSLGIGTRALVFGLTLGFYIVGLSCLARGETRARSASLLWVLFLLAPVLAALLFNRTFFTALCALPILLWIGRGWLVAKENVGRAIAIFLAGIVLVDLLAVSPAALSLWLGFAGLFAAALFFQRYVPAT